MPTLEARIAAIEERLEEERIAALETAIGVLLPETDAIRSLLAGLLVSVWHPELMEQIGHITGELADRLTYGSSATTQLLKPRAQACVAATLEQVTASVLIWARETAGGHA